MAGDSIFNGERGMRWLAHISIANQEAKGLGKNPVSYISVNSLLMCVAHVNQLSHMSNVTWVNETFYDLPEVSFHHHLETTS